MDNLRTPDSINRADPRSIDKLTLEERHRAVSKIQLHDDVPQAVTEIVETAKNLSLYSHFVVDFHAVSRLVCFTALEVALREKWTAVYGTAPDSKQSKLTPLLKRALEQRWIHIESFSWVRPTAEYNARVRALNKLYEQFPAGGFDPPKADEEAIQREINLSADWMTRWVNAAIDLRNKAAHGDFDCLDQSEGTLRLVVDAINGMFQAAPTA